MRTVVAAVAAVGVCLGSVSGAAAQEGGGFDANEVFLARCGTCHTVGQGVKIGPDLSGVTTRREREWLVPFIQSSQTMIASGDETAIGLFEEYGRQKMPDHHYTEEQIQVLLELIEAGGPEIGGPAVRPAALATAEEVDRGAALFFGHEAFEAGGTSCSACHTVTGATSRGGASIGGDLTGVYPRYHDKELQRYLDRLDRGSKEAIYANSPLSEDEAFLVKAFLARTARNPSPRDPARHRTFFPWLGLLVGVVLGVANDRLARGRRVAQ